MKIKIEALLDGAEPTMIDVGCRTCNLTDVFNGIGIDTDQGHFGIAMRDQGIEVMLDSKLVWSSTSPDAYSMSEVEERDEAYELASKGIVPCVGG